MNRSIRDDLDENQREVVEHIAGPMAVLAGAGTGKTRAITHRIAHAVLTGQQHPHNIMALTFTHRAAGEMRSRLRDLGVGQVAARTFHSAALRQLQYFWPNAVGGYVPEIRESKFPMVSQAAADLAMDTDAVLIRDLAAEIEWAKVSLIAPEEYAARAREENRPEVGGYSYTQIADLMERYEDVKSERAVIDFDDVLLVMIGIMRDRPDIAAQIRAQYRHFVVDEYQDVSPVQHRLLKLWLGASQDICVVGDVCQTIYSFAGAKADYLEGFTREFPRARTVKLSRDYRSTPQIVQLANSVIAENNSAAAVRLTSQLPAGVPVSYHCYPDDAAEAREIAQRIRAAHEAGTPLSDVAILYRTNAQSQEYAHALAQAGISYTVKDTTRFFDRSEVKAAMVALRATARGEYSGTLPECVSGILYSLGWRPQPPQEYGAARERWDALEALSRLAESLWAQRRASVAQFVAELEERAQMGNHPQTDAVTLASLHAAKGLEWAVVYLGGMSDGLMPISLADTAQAIAEERRLLYVGITRARQELHISYARSNPGRADRSVSPFLAEHWPHPQARSTQARQRAQTEAALWAASHPNDVELFTQLYQWRQVRAVELAKPEHTVLTEVTLRDLAARKPANLVELGQIKGIGSLKLAQFGVEILAVIADYQGS
ncbi:ATP-dependent helicase [Trueperella sp. LYQ143]|uniref:ATP-dependent helicase n=1 Tax=Trueperella sp. LYQ143 TaxID=3391059 RepID=UPI003983AFC6